MKLKIERKYLKDTYTIGKLYIDGKYFCDTLEDKDRGLTQDTNLATIKSTKIDNDTAIPSGTYKVTLDTVSTKYSNYSKYPWAKDISGKVPRLLNVPGFDGILIHVGNTNKDTSGCILVGKNSATGKVLNSTDTFNKLYKELLSDKDNLTLEIK